MALQGDLESIPINDVLRLLSRTGKSGRLDIEGDRGRAQAWLRQGVVVGAELPLAPDAAGPAEVLGELLRFRSGSFHFDGDGSSDGPDVASAVDDAVEPMEIADRKRRGADEAPPPLDAWVTLAAEIADDRVVVTRQGWRVLASVDRGATIRDLAERLGIGGELVWTVRDLAEACLVVVGTGAGLVPGATASSRLPVGRSPGLAPDAPDHDLHPSRDGWSYGGSHLKIVSDDPTERDPGRAGAGRPVGGSSHVVGTDNEVGATDDREVGAHENRDGDADHNDDGDDGGSGGQAHRSSLLRFLSSVKD